MSTRSPGNAPEPGPVAPTLPDTRGPFDPASLIHVVADAVIATDLTFHVTRWNRAAELLYGWSEAEALGQPVNDLLQTTYVVGERAAVLAALQAHGRWQGEVLQRTRSGQLIPILASVATVLAPDGTSLGIVTVNRDDRERQAAAAQLRAHAERLEVLTAASRAFAAVGMDLPALLDHVARSVVEALCDFSLVRLLSADEQLIQTVASAYSDPEDLEARTQLETITGGVPLHVDAPHAPVRVFHSGEPLLLPRIDRASLKQMLAPEFHGLVDRFQIHSLLIVAIRVQGRSIGLLTLCRFRQSTPPFDAADVTLAQDLADRAALAIANVRLYEQAQAAIHVRDLFLSLAAHELRTPLTSLLGHATRLARQARGSVQLTERDQLSLVRIQEHGRRLNRLVEDLVDASRLDRVRLSGPPARLDMAALVRGVAADIGPSLDVHQLQLGLPDAPLWLDGDGLRLEQVVANLIKNALKYSPAGGTIAVRLAQTATAVELSVADQGVGIPASDIPHLFEQYYRASNVDPQQIRGFGIGLSLVAAVVAEHGGDVQVSSVVGVGSTFTVVLPRVAAEPLSPPAMR